MVASPSNTIRSSSTDPAFRSFQIRCMRPSSDLRRMSRPLRGSAVSVVFSRVSRPAFIWRRLDGGACIAPNISQALLSGAG